MRGSFVPDPFSGMFPWNIKLLLLIDDNLGIEVAAMVQGMGRSAHVHANNWDVAESFATREGFPQHNLVLRPQSQDDLRIQKGIADWPRLKSCFDECLAQSDKKQVFIEMDLRAFANPSRMQRIKQATFDLLHRIQSSCPVCEIPGYWVTERQLGLPCSACGLPTSGYRNEIWSCLHCQHNSVRARTDYTAADPMYCSDCNP